MKKLSIIRSAGAVGAAGLIAAGLVTAGMSLGSAPAFAAAQTGNPAGFTFDLGPSPVGLPANCPFTNGDANFVFLSGTAVQYGTANKNGDWGGGTLEGTAQFFEGTTPLYQGHLTIWEGGGNNAQAQTEGGFTLDFTGSGAAGTLRIHVDGHGTTNDHGTETANVQNVSVTCA